MLKLLLWQIFRTLGTPNEKIWPGYAKLPGVKVNFVKQPWVSLHLYCILLLFFWVFIFVWQHRFFGLIRYNRLRDKFPAASFSGRQILSEVGFDLLNNLLTYDPDKVQFIISNWHLIMCCILIMHTCLSALVSLIQHISIDDALKHKWFSEVPLPKSKDFMPTFPALNELDR